MKSPLPRLAASFLSLSLVLAGCAGQGAPHAADRPALLPAPAKLSASQVAMVTIYRPDYGEDVDRHPTVSVNGSDLITPHRSQVFTARLLPGEYHFELDGDKAGDLRASAGQHYYFQLLVLPGGFSGRARLGIVSPAQAKDETARLQPIDKDDIENPAFR